MLNDTPTPSSSGSAMMLAKLSGNGSSTATSRVSSADRISGASTRPTSSTRRNASNRMMVIDTMAINAASRKAFTMVWLVASMVTADPPAFGRDLCHLGPRIAADLALLRASGVDSTCTRARPSGNSQSRETSGGIESSVTGSAFSTVRRRSS